MLAVNTEALKASLEAGGLVAEVNAKMLTLTQPQQQSLKPFFKEEDLDGHFKKLELEATLHSAKFELIKWGTGIGFAQAIVIALLHSIH